MMMTELENTKDQMLKKDFTNEINYTKFKIDECTEFSVVNLDALLRNAVSQAAKCNTQSYF